MSSSTGLFDHTFANIAMYLLGLVLAEVYFVIVQMTSFSSYLRFKY